MIPVARGALWPYNDIYRQCHSPSPPQPLGLMALVTGMAVSILNKRFMYNALLFSVGRYEPPTSASPCEDLCGKDEESAQIMI